MKFLCDQMLGTLAKWLRILGFDTFYANSTMDDSEILRITKNEKRILITRDKALSSTAKRENLQTIEIKSTDIDEQLKLVLKNIKLDENNFLSRCLLCNTLVEEIDKNKIKNKVPEKVFKNNEKFWYCPKCKRIY
ncbi:MAG: hypothetical protein DRM98_01370 [Thermoplasmata archaeon]|nr:MAG: hypothetical protein DRM98_01370 [Thermoplasmata archaeon]